MGEPENQPFQLSFAHITATLSPPVITRCCYSNGASDCLAAKLRPGKVHSARIDGDAAVGGDHVNRPLNHVAF